MNSIDQQLYEYIVENTKFITEKWSRQRRELSGPFYNNNTNRVIEEELNEQHALTIKTLATAFLEDSDVFISYLDKWANTVAQSRVDNHIPIHEVLEALSKTRQTVWEFIETFIFENNESVTTVKITSWSATYNTAFDKLNYMFSKKYNDINHSRLMDQQTLINELGSPLIPILEEVAVLPLVGDIDTNRARSILEITPQKCVESKINKIFIDVSAVPIIDMMVANELFKLTEVLGLLGIKTYISGVRPEVAQTAIQLGLDFSGLPTFSSLKQALAKIGVKKPTDSF
ncbi:STAS domain-containing protein [Bacillus sp. CECT 9360]|uniref:STAS domain-containing protein n=1 Tax=Bacillus sp. CECT 9360 TaxID=2845821 RepID=UPI001E5CDD15|nr:STAS domain-containing protein [Bacillus sp. CECT 9360]CAH0346013.1 RsbT co-antagonist protein RsbRD [Bacillus sp. CECT 9360]